MATDEYRAIMTTRTSKKNGKANIANIVMMMVFLENIYWSNSQARVS